jgi:hypothetical protein
VEGDKHLRQRLTPLVIFRGADTLAETRPGTARSVRNYSTSAAPPGGRA